MKDNSTKPVKSQSLNGFSASGRVHIVLDNYRIKSDDHQYILAEKKVYGEESKTPGESYWKDIGYYPNIPSLCDRFIDLNVRRSDIQSLSDLKDAHNKFTEAVWGLF